MNNVAEQAIKRSVSHNEIVTIAYDSDAASDLRAESKDSVNDADRRVTEYWGTTDAGDEWRVHMRAEPEGREGGFPGHSEDA